ncbi:MAG TPA: cupin domain-containing protein [Bryobacteraceae bacterium]|nr:cupin domain-containing protein [Bryobacteraceae bacterium]
MVRLLMFALVAIRLGAVESTVKIDNASVRVLSVTYQPHDKSILHSHAGNRVVILLDAGRLVTTYEGGRKEDQTWEAGEARWTPVGGKHVAENMGSKPVRIVEVEVKRPGPAQPARRAPALDPVVIDPSHNILLFENEQVRVFRSWREAGSKEKMHEHTGAGRVAVLLTDIDAKIESEVGEITALRTSAGDVLWSGPLTHSTTNVGPRKFEMIVVEVK